PGVSLREVHGAAAGEVVRLAVDDCGIQPVLRPEVLVDDGLGHAGFPRRFGGRGRFGTVRGEDGSPDLHHLLTAIGCREFLLAPHPASCYPSVSYCWGTY